MSDQTHHPESGSDKPLFRQADAQEQIYAPHQIPGALNEDQARDTNEPVVPGTLSTAIDTPIPGAKAVNDPLDQDDDIARRAR
jgi:hypothetical protein